VACFKDQVIKFGDFYYSCIIMF